MILFQDDAKTRLLWTTAFLFFTDQFIIYAG